jgi:hypothetical protein
MGSQQGKCYRDVRYDEASLNWKGESIGTDVRQITSNMR